MGVNEGFTEITNKSSSTNIRSIQAIGESDLLYFAEINGYCWNYAHEFLWPSPYNTEGYSRVGYGEVFLSDVDDHSYHPKAKELLKRFFKAYNLTVFWLLPKHII